MTGTMTCCVVVGRWYDAVEAAWSRRPAPEREAAEVVKERREDEKNTTTNQTLALDGRAAVVGGMVVVASSISAVLAVVWEEIFGCVGRNWNWPW